jgi:hypothetical protein
LEIDYVLEPSLPFIQSAQFLCRTGRILREAGLDTRVLANSDIALGGVDLFCAGVDRIITKGAKLGVHSWGGNGFSAHELPKNHPAHQYQLAYFGKMLGVKLGSKFYFYTLSAAPAAEIHYMSPQEQKRWNVGTKFVDK